jgi:hypothetical protein
MIARGALWNCKNRWTQNVGSIFQKDSVKDYEVAQKYLKYVRNFIQFTFSAWIIMKGINLQSILYKKCLKKTQNVKSIKIL